MVTAARLSRARCGPERLGAARSEETRCRFCDGELPDWKPVLTPSGEEVAVASPTMSVTFNGNVRPACRPRTIDPSSSGTWEARILCELLPSRGFHVGAPRASLLAW